MKYLSMLSFLFVSVLSFAEPAPGDFALMPRPYNGLKLVKVVELLENNQAKVLDVNAADPVFITLPQADLILAVDTLTVDGTTFKAGDAFKFPKGNRNTGPHCLKTVKFFANGHVIYQTGYIGSLFYKYYHIKNLSHYAHRPCTNPESTPGTPAQGIIKNSSDNFFDYSEFPVGTAPM